MFAIGVGIFTLASVVAALAPNVEVLNIARAVQGLGGAIVMPLTLTILSAAVPPAKRGLALGAWGAIGGLAIAFGPVVGGAVVEGFSWQYIFWLNVPIGILLVPLALTRLTESHGPAGKLDLPGVGLISAGMFGIVWGLIRGNDLGWTSPEILAALGLGVALVAAFVAWELRAPHPMLPMTFFRNAAFSLANLASLFMFFGMFGSIFLLTQFFQTVQGYSPLGSGLRILPWTLAPMFIAPFAGAMSDRVSPKRILSIGLTLQAVALGWIAFVSTPTTAVHRRSSCRSSSPASGWRCSSRRWRTSCSRPSARAGGPGLRRQQRDPRARRRVRRRRAGVGLLPLRRLRDRPDLRRRDDARAVDRCGRGRARRRRSVRDPGRAHASGRRRRTRSRR